MVRSIPFSASSNFKRRAAAFAVALSGEFDIRDALTLFYQDPAMAQVTLRLVTQRYDLDQADEAFRSLAAGEQARGLIIF